ncbi:MAG: Mce-associated rane protein [Nocardioidaceae bacterium]|jgi:Mce-associated membrane protein|nr:Mce-associated rane protein [Nocardioidaceae bacterium]
MTDVEEEHATEEAAPAPSRGPGYVLAITLAVLFGAAAIGMGFVAASARDSEAGDRKEAFTLAGRFTETLFSYDYREPDASRDRVLTMATGSFKDEYEQDFQDLFGPKIAESQLRLSAVVDDLYLSQIDSGTASALVVVDIKSSSKGAAPQLFGNLYLRLTMLKVDGSWKVDAVEYNVLSDTRIIAGESSSTTTTSASPTTSVP